jgi:hypothetical protein
MSDEREETLQKELENVNRFPYGRCRLISLASFPEMTYEQAAISLEASSDQRLRARGLWGLSRCRDTSTPTYTLKDGRILKERGLLLEAIIADGTYAHAVHNLAASISKTEMITLPDGRIMGQVDLFLETIRLNPHYGNAYHNLSVALPNKSSTVTLPSGRVVNRRDLCLEAIRLDPKDAYAINSLAVDLGTDETVVLAGSTTPLTKLQLYLLAISLDANYVDGFFNSSLRLSANDSLMLLDATSRERKWLLVQSLRCAPLFARGIRCLACTLALGERVTLCDGRRVTRTQLLAIADRVAKIP